MIIQIGLVTIIIAVLMSVMVPVFQQSRGAARSVVCIATLQKLSRMMAMYIQDYDETYPPLPKGRDLAHSTRSFTRPEEAWTKRMDSYLDPVDKDKPDVKENPFICPATDVPTYAYNAALGARIFPDYDPQTGPAMDAGVRKPAETYLFFDTANQVAGANALSGYRYFIGSPREGAFRPGDLVLPSGPTNRGWMRPRHAGSVNVLYCDGHTQRLSDPNVRLAERNPFDPAAP